MMLSSSSSTPSPTIFLVDPLEENGTTMSSDLRSARDSTPRSMPQRIPFERLSLPPTTNQVLDSTPPPSPTTSSSQHRMALSSANIGSDGRRRKHMHSSGKPSTNSNTISLRTTVRVLQDCRLSLIHIPLSLYPLFLQPILSLVLPLSSSCLPSNSVSSPIESSSYYSDESTGYQDVVTDETHVWSQEFVNISVTPIECSIVCSCEAAQKLFQPIINTLDGNLRNQVVISEDDFVVIQVEGEGLDAGRRVLELTSPLALAGVPIFFITTYFSDYILVPAQNRSHVTKALQRRGFVFEKHIDAFVAQTTQQTVSLNVPPLTPPPITLSDLQSQTFGLLKQQSIVPEVMQNARLLLCAGRRNTADETLYLGLVKVLVSQPKFLSITLTESESPSLLLLREMLCYFGAEDTLLGSKDTLLVPITLDLRELPHDSTGIVCGVAGRLAGQGTEGTLEQLEPVGMSYLSTARAGTVMVSEDDIQRAMTVLQI